MRFVFVFNRFHTNQFYSTKSLIDHGHEVKYFVKYKDQAEDYTFVNPTVIPEIKLWTNFLLLIGVLKKNQRDHWKKYSIPQFKVLVKELCSFKPDFIIIRDFNLTSIVTILVSNLLGITTILYTSRPKFKPNVKKSIWIRLFNFGRHVKLLPQVLITPVEGLTVSNSITESNVYYLPHCVEINSQSYNRSYFNNGKINILSIGKFSSKRKNLSLLISAVSQLSKSYNIKLTLIGSLRDDHLSKKGYDQIVSYIEEKGIENITTVKTNLSFLDTLNEYINCDLYVLPSSNEPNGVSHLESMAAGVPAICSDTNGTKNYIQEGRNGYIFKSDDVDSLLSKVDLIISDKENLIKMGKQSLEVVRELYLPEIFYNNFMDILRSEYPTKFNQK